MKFFENSIRYYVAITIMVLISLLATVFLEKMNQKKYFCLDYHFFLYIIYVLFLHQKMLIGERELTGTHQL